MKKIILVGICGLGFVIACAFVSNVKPDVTTFGSSGLIDIMI